MIAFFEREAERADGTVVDARTGEPAGPDTALDHLAVRYDDGLTSRDLAASPAPRKPSKLRKDVEAYWADITSFLTDRGIDPLTSRPGAIVKALNDTGYTTPTGLPFTAARVSDMRNRLRA